jgi:outer membrane protein assembly factor BamE (lipoprotein component of BamABCDE complex)
MKYAKFFVLSLMLSSLFVLSGCSYKTIKHGTEITDDQVSTIVNGQTTKEDVIMRFGEPTRTMDNEKTFFYTWTRGSKGHIMNLGSGKAHSKTLAIVFDDTNIVRNHNVTRGATTGAAVGD